MKVTGLVLPPVTQTLASEAFAKADGIEKRAGEGIVQKLAKANPATFDATAMPTYTKDGLQPSAKPASVGISVRV